MNTKNRNRKLIGGLGLCIGLALLGGGAWAQNNSAGAHHLPIGTPIKVTLLRDLSSATAFDGERVPVRVAEDDGSGLPQGTKFYGRVIAVHPATAHTPGMVQIRFDNGTDYDSPDFVNDEASAHLVGTRGTSDKSQDVTIGAGGGALLGLLRKGKIGDALEGGALGALGGYAVNQAQKHAPGDVTLKDGDEITMHLDRPLSVQTEVNAE